jgi:hypothetical protein
MPNNSKSTRKAAAPKPKPEMSVEDIDAQIEALEDQKQKV